MVVVFFSFTNVGRSQEVSERGITELIVILVIVSKINMLKTITKRNAK